MKTYILPQTDVVAPRVISGQMRIADKSNEAIRALYDAARAGGVNYFDHADIYGNDWHQCERKFADALQLSSLERDEIILQTKCGIIRGEGYYDLSYDHIMKQVNGSLEALGTDYIDFLLLHRPDALVEPEEVARAFDDLHRSGKVRHFGVSNHTPRQIDVLKTAVKQPLAINQLQLSLTNCPIVAQGIASNMARESQSVVIDGGGVLDYCRANQITVQAWSPFQARFFDGTFLGNPQFAPLNKVIARLAKSYGVAEEAIVASWITRHPAKMQVVLGTTTPDRLRAVAEGTVELTRKEWYELFRAADHIVP